MQPALDFLKLSIEDQYFSKSERKSLREILDEIKPTENQLAFLRSQIFELANQKATPENYRFIVEWIRDATSALMNTTPNAPGADAYFSPGETCRNIIIQQIRQAVNHLQICVFTISDDTITSAIIDSHKRGVPVKVITDNDKMLDEGSDVDQLADAGIPIRIDRTAYHMHHKFMITDNKALITGSYNWTRSAAKFNHENILLTREGGVIKSFAKEFDQLWNSLAEYE
jgi:mitochondrial cardiolipin hydrolase